MNTDYISYLRQIADEVVEQIVKPETLRAIIMPGSVAKGVADAYSDIELKFLWEGAEFPEVRAAIFQNIPKEELFAEALEDGEWTSAFLYKGVKIDVSHLEMPLLKTIIQEVMSVQTTSIASQTLLSAIQDSVVLHGDETVEKLRAQFADYPKELAARCVKVNATFTEWSMCQALYDRKDLVALHHLIDLTVLQMLRLLQALNGVYLSSYNSKWFRDYVTKLSVKPDNLEDRVEKVLTGPTETAIEDLTKLLHETMALVGRHRPDIDISREKDVLNYSRQKLQIGS